jgi:hypothetical protein
MADSDPVSSATRPHSVQPAGDADRRRQQNARRRRKRAEEKARKPAATEEDLGDEQAENDDAEQGPRGRNLDVRI